MKRSSGRLRVIPEQDLRVGEDGARASGFRILLVEDDADLAGILADDLHDEGHSVEIARDGAIAWELLERPSLPDIIVLDLMMPHMSGHEFRARQLGDERFARIPTLIMTGQPVDSSMFDAVGLVPILKKPFRFRNLCAAIAEVIEPVRTIKRCDCCGRTYDAHSWVDLKWVGEIDNGRAVGERLELRNCSCKSTLAWELGRHAVSIRVPAGSSSR